MISAFRFLAKCSLLSISWLTFFSCTGFAQASYKVFFTDIKAVYIQNNWFGYPKQVSYEASWQLYKWNDEQRCHNLVSNEQLASQNYEFYFWEKNSQRPMEPSRPTSNSVRTGIVSAQREYCFAVKCTFSLRQHADNLLNALSDTATILTGKATKETEYFGAGTEYTLRRFEAIGWILSPPGFQYLLFRNTPDDARMGPGSLSFLWNAKKADDNSSWGGKLAFCIIRFCFWSGIFILCLAWYRTHLSQLFPLKSAWNPIAKIGFENRYNNLMRDDYKALLDSIKALITDTTLIKSESEYNKVPTEEREFYLSASTIVSEDELRKKNVALWKTKGFGTVDEIQSQIADIEKSLNLPLSLKLVSWMGNMIRRIFSKESPKRVFNSSAEGYQILRLLSSGLDNLKINGFRWQKASAEVDRAIENRAAAELEQLKNATKIEWLWNFASIAPLAGLFGTVTGISDAFKRLGDKAVGGTMQVPEVIKMLGPNINEALWTTIFGLIVGILLTLFYFWYKRKLDWIYSKWEEICLTITEKI